MPEPGRIAIGALALGEEIRSGLDRYSHTLLDSLLPRSGTYCYSGSGLLRESHPGRVHPAPGGVVPRSDWRGNLARLLWHQCVLPGRLRRDGAALFYSPVAEGMLAPPVPQVITVHDLLPLHFPEVYPRLKYYSRHFLPRLVRASAAVIVDSEATRADLERFFGPVAPPVHVIYPGYDERLFRVPPSGEVEAIRSKYGLGEYLLSVGEIRAYKNIRALIEAFARAGLPDLELAIVGAVSRLDPEVVRMPERLGIPDRVRFLGYVPDPELPMLYAGAQAFVFPSLHEGFGLPPLEAMACGCPVVASSATSIPEVCGEAALYVDPREVESIAAGIRTIATRRDLRTTLVEAGLAQARRFRYQRTGKQIAALLEEVRARGAERTPHPLRPGAAALTIEEPAS